MNKLHAYGYRALAAAATAGTALFTAKQALAQDFGLTSDFATDAGLPTAGPVQITTNILNWVLGVIALIAVILVIYGGFTWMLSGGNQDKVDKGKKILLWSAIGLTIVLGGWGITLYILGILISATGA